MSEKILLQPPEIAEINQPVIFLAGPIQGAPDWQSEAASRIHRLEPAIAVASPRKEYAEGTFLYEKQVDWETHYLRQAGRIGVIAFWLAAQASETPGRAYAQTTRFELAEWKMRHEYEGAKLTVGIEDGFGNARYIRRRFGQDCPGVKIYDNLDEVCQNAVELISGRGEVPANPEFSSYDEMKSQINTILSYGWTPEGVVSWWDRPRYQLNDKTPNELWPQMAQLIYDLALEGREQNGT